MGSSVRSAIAVAVCVLTVTTAPVLAVSAGGQTITSTAVESNVADDPPVADHHERSTALAAQETLPNRDRKSVV